MDLLSKVSATVAGHSLLSAGDSVLIALSGGPDSVALLHLLCRMRGKLHLKLRAIYINHGIRPRAAISEERFCRDYCQRYRVPIAIVREDIPALARRQKKGLEETAREVRYRLFEQFATQYECNRVALGHHADDRAETILFRILRGTGRSGLLGIPVRRGKIIRPLFELTKTEVLTYLRERHLGFCKDRSNSSLDFSRNFLRNRLLVEIRERLNPQVDSALVRLAESFDSEELFLQDSARRAVRRVVKRTFGGKFALDLRLYRRYSQWVRRRMVRHCLQTLSAADRPPDRESVDRLDELAISAGRGLSLAGGIQAVTTADKLLIFRMGPLRFEQEVSVGGVALVEALSMKLRCRQIRSWRTGVPRKRGAVKVVLDADRMTVPFTLRSIRVGDRFRPLGMRGTKKVSDFLTDRKVPSVMRDEIPLLCDRSGIVWLVGHEIADRVKVTETTKKILSFEISYDKTDSHEAL